LTSTWVILWCTQPGWYPRWESDDWLVYTKIIIECAFGIASLFCLTRALAFATRNRPNRRSPEERGPDRLQLLRGYVLWSLLSAFLLIHFLASDLLGNLLLRCSPNTWTLWVLSFCTEHELARGVTLRESYVGMSSYRMSQTIDLNQVEPSAISPNPNPKPYSNWGRILSTTNSGHVNYHGLQSELNMHSRGGLTFQASHA